MAAGGRNWMTAQLTKISLLIIFYLLVSGAVLWKPFKAPPSPIDSPRIKALLEGTDENLPELGSELSRLKEILPPLRVIGFLTDTPANQMSSAAAQFQRITQRVLCPIILDAASPQPISIVYSQNPPALETRLNELSYEWAAQFADGFGIVRKKI